MTPVPRAFLAVSLALTLAWAAAGTAAELPKCLFVSSYHQGLEWSDEIARSLRETLAGKCQVRQFDMDTKRRKSLKEIQASALAAKAEIEAWRPDVVIAADDNASKFLIQPFYKDADLPFVFCGVNWTAEAYGFPYSNVTGMIEVAPVDAIFEAANELGSGRGRAFFLGADTLSASKNLERYRAAAAAHRYALDHIQVADADAWLAAFKRAQDYDLVILGQATGLIGWDRERILNAVRSSTRTLTVANGPSMVSFVAIAFKQVAQEQGEWAGQAALQILGGARAGGIPIVTNRRREVWVNLPLAEAAGLALPQSLVSKAMRFVEPQPKS